MSWSVTMVDGTLRSTKGNYMEFYCDSASDVADLPTGGSEDTNVNVPKVGSLALVNGETPSIYVLKGDHVWGKLKDL